MSADGDIVRAGVRSLPGGKAEAAALAALARLEAERDNHLEWRERYRDSLLDRGRQLTATEAQRDALAEALRNIAANAFGWHGPEGEQDTGPVRALAVIGKWAEDALAEAGLE